MRWIAIGAAVLAVGVGQPNPARSQAAAPDEASVTPPPDAAVYVIAPRPGARVTSPVTVQFGLRNMGVTQAGSTAKNAGHHHLLVDVGDALPPGEAIPADKNHLHFGAGQTETRVDLPPGRHSLQLVLGDAHHRPFKPSVQSAKVEVVVVTHEPKRKRARRRRRT